VAFEERPAEQLGMSGWRITFVFAGSLGLLLVLPLLLVRDKRTPRSQGGRGSGDARGTAVHLRHVRGYIIPLMAGNALFALFLYGYPQWVVVMFQRVHGWTLEQTGIAFGAVAVSHRHPSVRSRPVGSRRASAAAWARTPPSA
jgi:predicted MFS family arabinose efflux permease